MPVIVSGGGANRVVSVAKGTGVTVVVKDTAAVGARDQSTVAVITRPTEATVGVSTPGVQGPRGPSGDETADSVDAFSFGDASPATLMVLDSAVLGLRVALTITTPFNGAGASIAIGTTASPALILPPERSDPTESTTFETKYMGPLPALTAITLTLTPGFGASQGAGVVVIEPIYPES